MDLTASLANHPPSGIAVACGAAERTWAEFDAGVEAVAAAVAGRDGYRPGRVVGVIGPTSIEFLEAILGCLRAGLAVLPLDPRSPAPELSQAVGIAEPGLVIDVGVPEIAAPLADAGTEVLDRSELIDSASDVRREIDLADDEPALLLFTSGTAGPPHVAVLTASNVAASIEQTLAGARGINWESQVILGVMPLTHVLGLVGVAGVAMAVGATLVLTPDPTVEAVVRDVERHQVTAVVAPPVFWFRLVEADVDPLRMASVEIALSGAAPLSGRLAAQFAQSYALPLRQGYGLTEASPGLTSSIGTDAPATSVGRPLPGVELRLVDDFGDDALIGEVGEVWARGPNIFAGYMGDEEATAAVLDDEGWLHTGDLAVVDERGFVYIVGRSKDQIIVAGFNVHPGEVEALLMGHPQVEGAAVVGAPDREYGEIVVAWVVADGARPTETALAEYCRDQLAGYKVPSRFEFVDELPRGLNGKVRRRVLRTQESRLVKDGTRS